MIGEGPTGMSQSIRVSTPTTTQMDGSIFMLKKDSQFPDHFTARMTFLAQSATTMKSKHSGHGV
jgi:hypothetical protein